MIKQASRRDSFLRVLVGKRQGARGREERERQRDRERKQAAVIMDKGMTCFTVHITQLYCFMLRLWCCISLCTVGVLKNNWMFNLIAVLWKEKYDDALDSEKSLEKDKLYLHFSGKVLL
jgi:hypothetical protein